MLRCVAFGCTERPGGIFACDTYLPVDMLRPDQLSLHRELQCKLPQSSAIHYWR